MTKGRFIGSFLDQIGGGFETEVDRGDEEVYLAKRGLLPRKPKPDSEVKKIKYSYAPIQIEELPSGDHNIIDFVGRECTKSQVDKWLVQSGLQDTGLKINYVMRDGSHQPFTKLSPIEKAKTVREEMKKKLSPAKKMDNEDAPVSIKAITLEKPLSTRGRAKYGTIEDYGRDTIAIGNFIITAKRNIESSAEVAR